MSGSAEVYVMSYDIGSTGCKTCLYSIGNHLRLVDSALSAYPMTPVNGGGVEQDPDDWWNAMIQTTGKIMSRTDTRRIQISGISFSAQMQGLVLVDGYLKPVRPAMSYMDQRSAKQKAALMKHGFQVEGMNVNKLLRSLAINGAVAASVKDPVWKYKWVQENEPEAFSRVRRWLDVKDYLSARATGVCTMTADSAFATCLSSRITAHRQWSRSLLAMYGVDPSHMPHILGSTDMIGSLLPDRARELSLPAGIPVFGGGGDASMISVGAGATEVGDAYVYTGTSGWVSLTVDKAAVDVRRRIAAITGAQDKRYLYFAEQELRFCQKKHDRNPSSSSQRTPLFSERMR